jgi:hypothetical protein
VAFAILVWNNHRFHVVGLNHCAVVGPAIFFMLTVVSRFRSM